MQFKIGDICEGKVVGIKEYGAFVEIAPNLSGMVHISELSSRYIKNIEDFLKIGDTVTVKIIAIKDRKISLSIKAAAESLRIPEEGEKNHSPDKNFEEMISKFKKQSEEKLGELKILQSSVKRTSSSKRFGHRD